jgi:protein-S-isoprenylcysteine O-methyltransferase Ste14
MCSEGVGKANPETMSQPRATTTSTRSLIPSWAGPALFTIVAVAVLVFFWCFLGDVEAHAAADYPLAGRE